MPAAAGTGQGNRVTTQHGQSNPATARGNEQVGAPIHDGWPGDLDLANLLGRAPGQVDRAVITGYLRGARVLVAGAAGAIGGELARQIAGYGPASLVLLDLDDEGAGSMARSLASSVDPGTTAIVAEAADIADRVALRAVLERHRPEIVFHAAALKDVPALEAEPVAAVRANVLGTWWLASLAVEHGCTRFVHVSSAKAASPCSVMGASKRVAEHLVGQLGRRTGRAFLTVRLGNVIGGAGSMVPTFIDQIQGGGPVTVWGEEMTRRFLTGPEAVGLLLEAGGAAAGPATLLIESGEPVSIVEMVERLIRASGLRPDDIAITVTRPGPGERVHEVAYDDAETLEPTTLPAVSRLVPKVVWDQRQVVRYVDRLEDFCASGDNVGAAKLLEVMLQRVDVACRLSWNRPEVARRQAHRDLKLPAVLGGPAAFTAPLPFCRPSRAPLDEVTARLATSYDQGILTNGPLVAELEERLAERLGVASVVAVASCTHGLMLALQAVTDGRPGHVVLPSFTFSASGHAVAWNGRTPRFVECDRTTFQIDLDHAARHLEGAAALMPTHIFGAPADPIAVEELAAAYDVPVLFDAAHALGSTAAGRPVGGFGSVEVFSLTPTKVLVAGEGGLVATNDQELAARIRIGRNYADPGNYDTRFSGLNARMSEFHAAMALASLERFDDALARRRQIAFRYRKLLADVPGVQIQAIDVADESTFKDLSIAIDPEVFGLTRDQLVQVLVAEEIETRNYFDPPVHRHAAYAHLDPVDLPVTEQVSSQIVSLPIYIDLSDDDVGRIAEAVHSAHEHADRILGVLNDPTMRGIL